MCWGSIGRVADRPSSVHHKTSPVHYSGFPWLSTRGGCNWWQPKIELIPFRSSLFGRAVTRPRVISLSTYHFLFHDLFTLGHCLLYKYISPYTSPYFLHPPISLDSDTFLRVQPVAFPFCFRYQLVTAPHPAFPFPSLGGYPPPRDLVATRIRTHGQQILQNSVHFHLSQSAIFMKIYVQE